MRKYSSKNIKAAINIYIICMYLCVYLYVCGGGLAVHKYMAVASSLVDPVLAGPIFEILQYQEVKGHHHAHIFLHKGEHVQCDFHGQ